MDGLLGRIIAEIERLKEKYYKRGKESACIYNRSIEERERCCKYCSAACQARIMQ